MLSLAEMLNNILVNFLTCQCAFDSSTDVMRLKQSDY